MKKYEIDHIKVLDGIRAISIMIVVWYHFWQQSWLIPRFGNFSLDIIPRYGYLFVDMLILLSGFCLFLPYARSMVYKEKIPNTKQFYLNRIARIVPSYLVSMIIAIIFIILLNTNINPSFFIKDTLSHLTFTHNLFKDTLASTYYFGVLWTVAVEVQFYLIFPFIAKKFSKKPILTYIVMLLLGIIITIIFRSIANNDNLFLLVNHTLTFIPVFANGMLGAWLYILFTKKHEHSLKMDIVFTIISIVCIYLYYLVCMEFFHSTIDLRLLQISYRIPLSFIFLLFIISTILSCKIYRFLFENKFMKFMAVISFNLYIYHQFIAVKLKELRIPYWKGSVPPNLYDDYKWMWTYFILCVVISIIVAIIMTYLVEKPMSKYIKNRHLKKT